MQQMMSNLKKASNKDVSTYPGFLTESFNGKESVNDITTSFIDLVYGISIALSFSDSLVSFPQTTPIFTQKTHGLLTLALVGFHRLHVYIVVVYLDSSFLGTQRQAGTDM